MKTSNWKRNQIHFSSWAISKLGLCQMSCMEPFYMLLFLFFYILKQVSIYKLFRRTLLCCEAPEMCCGLNGISRVNFSFKCWVIECVCVWHSSSVTWSPRSRIQKSDLDLYFVCEHGAWSCHGRVRAWRSNQCFRATSIHRRSYF